MVFSDPYLNATIGFIVPDHRRNEFATRKAVQDIPDLKIGIQTAVSDYFFEKVKEYLPRAEIVDVHSIREFFESNEQRLDAMLFGAEAGSAWTLLYPAFQAVVPIPDIYKIPVAYPVAGRDRAFADFLSHWITLRMGSRDFEILYEHCFLGIDAVPKQPRWSVIRDVLKWGE